MDTMIRKIALTTALAALVCTVGSARADDTDVYMNPGSGLPSGSEPMVMFSLDYRPNLGSTACTGGECFSLDYRPNLGSTACTGGECEMLIDEGYMSASGPYTFFDVLRGALRKVFDPLEGIRVGLMVNHDNNNDCVGFGRSNGGYIAMGFERFEENDSNGAKAQFHKILDSMPTPQGNVSHSYQGKELFFEFFRYLTGQSVFNAHNGYTDFGTQNTFNLDVDYPAVAWDSLIEWGPKTKPSYVSPLEQAGACSKLYTVNVLFQVSNQEDDSDAAIAEGISDGGFGSPQRAFPDVIQYLYDADLANGNYGSVPDLDDKQNVISYFIVDETKINTTTNERGPRRTRRDAERNLQADPQRQHDLCRGIGAGERVQSCRDHGQCLYRAVPGLALTGSVTSRS
jgi:type IV pilus assembly protein PilY1